jgi:hypothetical protein
MSNPSQAVIQSQTFDQVTVGIAQVAAGLPTAIPGPQRTPKALLASLLALVRTPLTTHGLTLNQLIGCDFNEETFAGGSPHGVATVITEIRHLTSGQFVRSTLRAIITDATSSGMTEAIDDLRLYALSALLGIDRGQDAGSLVADPVVPPAPAAPHAPVGLAPVAPATPPAPAASASAPAPAATAVASPAAPPMEPSAPVAATPATSATLSPEVLKKTVDELNVLCKTLSNLHGSAVQVRTLIKEVCQVASLSEVKPEKSACLETLRQRLEADIATLKAASGNKAA